MLSLAQVRLAGADGFQPHCGASGSRFLARVLIGAKSREYPSWPSLEAEAMDVWEPSMTRSSITVLWISTVSFSSSFGTQHNFRTGGRENILTKR